MRCEPRQFNSPPPRSPVFCPFPDCPLLHCLALVLAEVFRIRNFFTACVVESILKVETSAQGAPKATNPEQNRRRAFSVGVSVDDFLFLSLNHVATVTVSSAAGGIFLSGQKDGFFVFSLQNENHFGIRVSVCMKV